MRTKNEEILSAYFKARRVGVKTRESYQQSLTKWDKLTDRDLEDANVSDAMTWYGAINSEGAKPGTILTYRSKLRALQLHAKSQTMKKREAEIMVNEVWDAVPVADLSRDLKLHKGDRDKLVTPEDVDRIIKSAKHPRVQALISMLIESGCRKGELRSLRIKDITFGPEYTELRVEGKTGERTLPIVHSVPYLKQWLSVHPDRRPDQWLFTVEHDGKYTQINEYTINTTLRYLAKKNGLSHIYPHQLRHTLLTSLAKSGLGEYVLKSYAGWTPNSRQASTYIHLSGRSHIDAVLTAQGLRTPEPDKIHPILKTSQCPQCGAAVGGDMVFCPGCGYVIDERMRVEKTSKMAELEAKVANMEKALMDIYEREKAKPPHI